MAQRRVTAMRDIAGLGADEVCDALGRPVRRRSARAASPLALARARSARGPSRWVTGDES